MTLQPLDIAQARDASRLASSLQRGAEDALREAAAKRAAAERAYRLALSKRLVELRAEGVAATACADVAKGEQEIADLRYARDVAEGLVEACRQAMYRHMADRRDLSAILAWSARRDIAEGFGDHDDQQPQHTFGGRRAAA